MRNPGRSAVVAVALVVLAGCGQSGPSPSSSAPVVSLPVSPPITEPSSSASAAASPADSAAASASVDAVPSEDLGPFSCDLPFVEDATVPRANLTDVRIGTHAGYDRVVFEFEQGTPELTLDRATPPFTQDASGLPIAVDGSSHLRLTMRGGTKQTDAGGVSYDGPTEFEPGLPSLVELVEGGDFDAQSTWYLGLSAEACVRVLRLDGPPRLVIDLEH